MKKELINNIFKSYQNKEEYAFVLYNPTIQDFVAGVKLLDLYTQSPGLKRVRLFRWNDLLGQLVNSGIIECYGEKSFKLCGYKTYNEWVMSVADDLEDGVVWRPFERTEYEDSCDEL